MKSVIVLSFLLMLVLGIDLHGQGTWKTIYPGEVRIHFRSVSFITELEGYVAGWSEFADGSVSSGIHGTRDGGKTWQTEYFSSIELNEIHFSDGDNGVAVGRDSACNCPVTVSTSDGGMNWSTMRFENLTGSFFAVDFINTSTGALGGGNPETGEGYVLRTDDGGKSYTIVLKRENTYVSRLDLITSGTIVVGAGEIAGIETRLYRTDNADADPVDVLWENIKDFGDASLINSIDFIDGMTGYVVLTSFDLEVFDFTGDVYKTTDGGYNWERIFSSVDFTLVGVDFLDAVHGISVGSDGVIIRTEDGGRTWTDTVTGAAQLLIDVACVSPSVAYTGGTNGVVLKYENDLSGLAAERPEGSAQHIVSIVEDREGGQILVVQGEAKRLTGHKVIVVDLRGNIVAEQSITESGETVNLDHLTTGTYLYRVSAGGRTVETGKFLCR